MRRTRKQLHANPMPAWLSEVDQLSEFDKEKVLKDSIYYPGSYFDGAAIQAYSGFAHSFVFVDYGVKHELALKRLPKLAGYEIFILRDLNRDDLTLNPFLQVTLLPEDFYPPLSESETVQQRMTSVLDEMKGYRGFEPYCIWAVYTRKPSTNAGHGPERLSILFICGEGVATYKAIYNANDLYPMGIIICTVDAGGFGGNWTQFERRGGIFERTVMRNAAGIPKYLFTDQRYNPNIDPSDITTIEERDIRFARESYWEKYTKEVPNRSFLSIWTHA